MTRMDHRPVCRLATIVAAAIFFRGAEHPGHRVARPANSARTRNVFEHRPQLISSVLMSGYLSRRRFFLAEWSLEKTSIGPNSKDSAWERCSSAV